MKYPVVSSISPALTALFVFAVSLPVLRAADPPPTTSAHSREQTAAAARPEVEKQRQEAEQQAKNGLDPDAIAAIQETQQAVKAIADGKTNEALAAIERASGKINVAVARSPATALLPVEAQVIVIDAAPTGVKAISQIAKRAEIAIGDKDYPAARVLLRSLCSEIRVRTYHIPLATYPASLAEAARLLDQKKTGEASDVLMTALNTLVVIDRVTPLPLVVAQAAIESAQAESSKDKNAAQALLATAKLELNRAKELGYAGNDPEYTALNQSVSELEKQLKGTEDTASAFSRLKERVASFFRRLTGSEKTSQVASR
jgi:hypothetical protein